MRHKGGLRNKVKESIFMKAKHIIWIVSAIVAVVAMAAGIAVIVDKYFGDRIAKKNYIECDSDEEEQLLG